MEAQMSPAISISQGTQRSTLHPTEPRQGVRNLFTLIFKLLAEEKIFAYEYLAAKSSLQDEYQIDFQGSSRPVRDRS
jgi:hypothetical protein